MPKKATSSYPSGQSTTNALQYYNWATFLNVKLKQVEQTDERSQTLPYSYELIGADDTSVVYLERLVEYLNRVGRQSEFAKNSNAYLLYGQGGGQGSGLLSAALGDAKSLLVQANLSTYTNPSTSLAFAAEPLSVEAEPNKNLINSFASFVELLWEASIVRSGGFYLYYENLAAKQGLPDDLFANGPIAEISLVLSFPLVNNKVENFVNCLIVGDSFDPSADTLFVEDNSLIAKVAVTTPGNIGFEARRTIPESHNFNASVLMEQNYNLLGYRIGENTGFSGSVAGLPVGPENPIGSTLDQYYHRVVPISKYYKATFNQLHPLGTAGPTGPVGENNPYLGVGATAKLELDWVDLFGNKTSFTEPGRGIVDKVELQQKLGYTDSIIAVSKLPSSKVKCSWGSW